MDLNTALEIIKQALNQATTKGAFNMQDVATIVSALQIVSDAVSTETETIPLKPENTK